MYLQNKYTIVYNNIINRAKSRVLDGYGEFHHIIPRSLGGCNSKENIVKLTAREHFICHRLLVKMVEGSAIFKMMKAVDIMTMKNKSQDRYHVNSRTFEKIKIAASIAMSRLTKGKSKHTEKSKKILSTKALGRPSAFKGKSQPASAKKTIALSKSKPCVSPLGERFNSTKEAGIAYNISGVAIRGLIQRGKSGWRYERLEDQTKVEDRRSPKKERRGVPQTQEHIQKRVEARARSGHYKNREATIERMSIAAKAKHNK